MSIRKDTSAKLIVAGVLVVIVSVVALIVVPNMLHATTNVWIGDGIFKARVALNEADRVKGLSGVAELDANEALLMAFPYEARWKIGMKDMKIPIDIVWLNKDKKIIYVVKNASPDMSSADAFEPKTPALYVIELPAGSVDGKAIKINRTAVFQVNLQEVK